MFLYAFGHYACLPIGALTEKKVKQKIRLSQYEIIFSTLLFCFKKTTIIYDKDWMETDPARRPFKPASSSSSSAHFSLAFPSLF